MQTGISGELDCSVGSGCVVNDYGQPSFGDGFGQAGGGVFATQFDIAGVFIWFWSRPDVPQELYQDWSLPLDISTWGLPVAAYPSDTCNMLEFFGPQQLVIDTTFCGDWAGVPAIYQATCNNTGSTNDCYLDNVIGAGSPKFDDAYWEIANIRLYTTAAPPSPTNAAALQANGSIATVTGSPPTPTLNIQNAASARLAAVYGVQIMTVTIVVFLELLWTTL